MPNVTNKTITKIYKGPSGSSEYGPWQLYNIYFEGSKNKYSWMQSGKKIVPTEGLKVAYLEYEVTTNQGKDGKTYTNYEIKEMKLDESQPEQKSNPVSTGTQSTKPKEAYIDHGKCVIEIMQMANDESQFIALIAQFKRGITMMLSDSIPNAPAWEQGENQRGLEGFDNPPPFDPDEVPLDEIPF